MEGNTHLLQVIRKMRSQINKLERENRALRGELQVCRQSVAPPPETGAARGGGNGDVRSLADDGEGPTGPPASLHGNMVANPAPTAKEQTDTTMTVRRYSTALPAPAASAARSRQRPPSTGLLQAPGRTPPLDPPAATQLHGGEEKGLQKTLSNCLSNSHSRKVKLFQEHFYRCRGKVKAVSFLLPMDMSSYAENQGSLKSPQNQSTKQLTTITEKDM